MDGGSVTDIGNHGLTCLGEEEYAAVALYMQATAKTVEDNLTAQQAAFDAYRNRTSILFTSTISSSYAAGSVVGGVVMPDGRLAGVTTMTGATVSGGGATVLSVSSVITMTVPRSGWYDFGGYCNVIAAGAITANSERLIYTQVRQTPEPAGGNPLVSFRERTIETNTGGEFLNVSGLVFLLADRNFTVAQYVTHENLASNVVTQAGAKIWLAYMGPKGSVVVNA